MRKIFVFVFLFFISAQMHLDQNPVLVLRNNEDYSIKASASVYWPDLDVWDESSGFKLTRHKSVKLYFEELSAQPDYYPVIITVYDDEGRRYRTHNWVYIG